MYVFNPSYCLYIVFTCILLLSVQGTLTTTSHQHTIKRFLDFKKTFVGQVVATEHLGVLFKYPRCSGIIL